MRNGMIMGSPMMIVMCLMIGILVIVAFWRVSAKAGFPGWYGVAVVIPIVNVLFVFFLAFAEWPIERTLSTSQRSSGEV